MLDLDLLYHELDSIIDNKVRKIIHVSEDEIGSLCEDLCLFYRTAAIAALLLEMDIERFNRMLIYSGLTRLYLLKQTEGEAKNKSRFCKITRANGFFDSVAAGRFDVAKDIVALSPLNRNEKFEYEDDYCYVLFLQKTVTSGNKNLRWEILKRFEKVLEGEASPKLGICNALFKQDSEMFEDSFLEFLELWTDEIEYQEVSMSRNEVEFSTARHVCIEGLALLRFSEIAGIVTQEEYEYCPKEARMPIGSPFPDFGYPK